MRISAHPPWHLHVPLPEMNKNAVGIAEPGRIGFC
jgi:hypothetical protein